MACSSGGDGEDAPPICARREALTVGLTGKAADQLRKIRGLYSQRLRPPGSPADTPDEFHSLLSRSGTLSHLSGKYLSVPVPVPPAATPDQVALSFLKTYPDLHGLDLTSSLFVLKQAVALPTGDVNVVLQQYTNGVKVLGAEVRMMVSPQREVRSYHGRSSPDIALPAKPVVSSDKALQVAAANSPAAVADQVELVYLDPRHHHLLQPAAPGLAPPGPRRLDLLGELRRCGDRRPHRQEGFQEERGPLPPARRDPAAQ